MKKKKEYELFEDKLRKSKFGILWQIRIRVIVGFLFVNMGALFVVLKCSMGFIAVFEGDFWKTLIPMSLTIFSFSLTMRNLLVSRVNDEYYIPMTIVFDICAHRYLKAAWYIVLGTPLAEILLFGITYFWFRAGFWDKRYVNEVACFAFFEFIFSLILTLYYFHSVLKRMNEEEKVKTVARYLADVIIKSCVTNGETKRKFINRKNNLQSYICSIAKEKPLFYTKYTLFKEFSGLMNKIFFEPTNKIFEKETKFDVPSFIEKEIENTINDLQKEQDYNKIQESLMNEETKFSYIVLSNLFLTAHDNNAVFVSFLKSYIADNIFLLNDSFSDDYQYCYGKFFVLFYTLFENIKFETAFEELKEIIQNDLKSSEIKANALRKINEIVLIALCYVFCTKKESKFTVKNILDFMAYWCIDPKNINQDALEFCKKTYNIMKSQSTNNIRVIEPLMLLLK